MTTTDALPAPVSRLRCPRCGSGLTAFKDRLGCGNDQCGGSYPLVSGVPDFVAGLGLAGDGHDHAGHDGHGEHGHDGHDVETDYLPRALRNGAVSQVTRVDVQFDFLRDHLSNVMGAAGRPLDVLDLGCGTRLTRKEAARQAHFDLLRDTCRSYAGLDPSLPVIERISRSDAVIRLLPDPVLVRGVGEKLPFPNEAFDAVLILSVLDHCVDPPAVLAESERVLRPGGVLLLNLGKRDSWHFRVLSRVAPAYQRRLDANDHHHVHYSVEELVELTSTAGLTELDTREYGFVSLPKRLSRVEDLAYRVSTAVVPEARIRRALGTFDAALARRLPGMGSGVAVAAHRRGASPEG